MPEYIEREKALQLLNKNSITKKITLADGVSIYNTIEKIPTADVVEVVRCGQCQHWKINPHNLYGGYCPYSERASLDHFCSYGKRKEVKNV